MAVPCDDGIVIIALGIVIRIDHVTTRVARVVHIDQIIAAGALNDVVRARNAHRHQRGLIVHRTRAHPCEREALAIGELQDRITGAIAIGVGDRHIKHIDRIAISIGEIRDIKLVDRRAVAAIGHVKALHRIRAGTICEHKGVRPPAQSRSC